MSVNVTIVNNSDLIRDAKDDGVERALEAIGLVAEGYATALCPVDTSNLKQHISHAADDTTAYVGTNVEYAPYVEYGTGRYAEGGGRSTPWTYQDDEGNWHTTTGAKAQPFLRPAIRDHIPEYKDLVEIYLKG